MEATEAEPLAGQQSLRPHEPFSALVSPGVLQRAEVCSQKRNVLLQQLCPILSPQKRIEWLHSVVPEPPVSFVLSVPRWHV